MHRLRIPAVLAAVLLAPAAVRGQFSSTENRYELGLRLRAFDRAWDEQTDAARKRSVEALKRANFLFLTKQDGEAARNLDLARLLLQSAAPQPAAVWAVSCMLRPEARLVDAGRESLPVTLDHFYRPKPELPENVELRLSFHERGIVGRTTLPLAKTPLKGSLRFPKPPADGDYTLSGEIVQDKKVLARVTQTVSVVKDLEERLKQVEKGVASLPKDLKMTDALTVKSLASLLRELADGKTLETDYPAARLQREAEEVLKAIADDKSYYGRDKPGQFWLTLPVKDGSAPVRVQVPTAAKKGKPLPLVVAVHGAGGSENMFFDAYGNGIITRLCGERGWLLVATRNGLADGVLDEIARLYPVDPKAIFLVGHSLGAAQVVTAAGRNPERFAGVAALGGGGRVVPSEALKGVAFFVGAGTEDFLLGGARVLNDNLKKAEVKRVRYKEYKDTEHLVVVQRALPEVFAFFDEVLKR
jgi:predicted esterase